MIWTSNSDLKTLQVVNCKITDKMEEQPRRFGLWWIEIHLKPIARYQSQEVIIVLAGY
jgi:hypothetical protein